MLRRVVATVMLAGLAVACGLPLLRAADGAPPAGSRAVRLVAPGGEKLGGRWQSWANASLVPTVTGRVTVRVTGCPGLPKAAGCVYPTRPRVVYLRAGLRDARAVLLHELGHVYDLTVLSNSDRGRFRRIMRRPGVAWWKGRTPLAEWFAEAYAWCARYKRIVSVRRYAIHAYNPTPAQHRSVCALIRRAAIDKTPPKRPAAPPVVADDPAPPAPPPPTAIPGDPIRDAGMAPTVTPQPKAASTPTPTSTPTVHTAATATPTATPRFPRRTPTPEPSTAPPPAPPAPTETLETTAQPDATPAAVEHPEPAPRG